LLRLNIRSESHGEFVRIRGVHYKINKFNVQGGSNMTGTDLCVNKPHCAAAVRP